MPAAHILSRPNTYVIEIRIFNKLIQAVMGKWNFRQLTAVELYIIVHTLHYIVIFA